MDAGDVQRWAKWMMEKSDPDDDWRDHERTIETMPADLIHAVRTKNERKHLFKGPRSSQAAATTASQMPQLAPTIQFVLPPNLLPLQNFMGTENTSNATAYLSSQSVALRSSPPASEDEDELRLDMYMKYLIRKNPTKHDRLEKIAEQFKDEDMTMKKLHKMNVQGLKDNFGISYGLAMEIVDNIKAWMRTNSFESQIPW